MDGDRELRERLAQIENRLDRLLQLVVLVLMCQPLLLVGLLMPDVTAQIVCYLLIAVLVTLAVFPNLENRLPGVMHAFGSFVGRTRRRLRSFALR